MRSAVASTPISSGRRSSFEVSAALPQARSSGSHEATSRSKGRTMVRRASSTTSNVWHAEARSPISSTQDADLTADQITVALGQVSNRYQSGPFNRP